jgi:SARP family transcriptional regulator, regulator of embCAB operon
MTLAARTPTRIQLCGPTIVERDRERFEDRLPGRQGRLLFAYLVLNRHRVVGRTELAAAIWPELQSTTRDAGLNPLISKLRKLFGADALEGRSTLRLRLESDSRVDVEDAIQAVHRAESQVALGHWKLAWAPSLVALFVTERDFLPGEDGPWIDEQRRALADVYLRALESYAAAALGTGGTELPASIRAARKVTHLAPLRESGYEILMRGLSAQGNPAEALRVYGDLRQLLRDELGASPCAATEAVYNAILKS